MREIAFIRKVRVLNQHTHTVFFTKYFSFSPLMDEADWPVDDRRDSVDGGSALSQGRYLTQDNTNTEETRTDIHAWSRIRNHDPSASAAIVIGLWSIKSRVTETSEHISGKNGKVAPVLN
jgi:hypothetical protein